MKDINIRSVAVQVVFLREEDYIIAYAPALELSAYGKSRQAAMKAFEGAIEIFLEETERKGTLEKVLLKLGWSLHPGNYKPPMYPTAHLKERCGDVIGEVRNKALRMPVLCRAN